MMSKPGAPRSESHVARTLGSFGLFKRTNGMKKKLLCITTFEPRHVAMACIPKVVKSMSDHGFASRCIRSSRI